MREIPTLVEDDPPVCGLFMIGMAGEREKADLTDLAALLAMLNNMLLR